MKNPLLFARSCFASYCEEYNVSPYWRCRDPKERRVPLEMMALARGNIWREWSVR